MGEAVGGIYGSPLYFLLYFVMNLKLLENYLFLKREEINILVSTMFQVLWWALCIHCLTDPFISLQ